MYDTKLNRSPKTASAHITIIGPPARFPLPSLRELWEFRDLFMRFASRDLRLRYRQTLLGVTWVVLQPLLAAGIFTFVFGRVAGLDGGGVPYFAFAYVGMTTWNVFAQCLTKSSGSLVGNTHLISKVFFPRLILPLSTLGSTLVDLLVSSAMGAVILAVSGVHPGVPVLTLPAWFGLAAVLGTGLGLVAASLMVSYRDVAYILPVATQFLLYATPVAYPASAIPEGSRWVADLNPLSGIIQGAHWAALNTGPPQTPDILWSVLGGLFVLIVGLLVFTKLERRFADVI